MYHKQILILLFLGHTAHLQTQAPVKKQVQKQSTSTSLHKQEKAKKQKKLTEKTITVFVHGTFLIRPHMSLGTIINLLADNIDDSVYTRTLELNRQDPYFFQNQAISYLGLQKINIAHPSSNQASSVIANIYNAITQQIHYGYSDEYYTFGWSGLVSNKFRHEEAGLLYTALSRLTQMHKEQGITLHIRLICYSHGGNLGLHLGSVHITKNPHERIYIPELYLIGTPIQCETDFLINSDVFGHVYNIYSPADGVQTLDFFSFKRFFSNRRFALSNRIQTLQKVTQIKLKITEYIPKTDLETIVVPKNEKERKKLYKKRIFDPGHYELWFMGWSFSNYRESLPFYPLPTIVFLPVIINNLVHNTNNLSQDVVVTLEPALQLMTISNYKDRKKHKKTKYSYPFLPAHFIANLENKALQYKPTQYNLETAEEKIIQAKAIANYEYEELQKLKKRNKQTIRKKQNVLIPENSPLLT